MNMLCFKAFILACLLAALAGCATPPTPTISFMMGTVADGRGGTGELFVSESARTGGGTSIGKVRDAEGRAVGDILTTSPLDTMMLHSFKNEMKSAGYRVVAGEAVPPAAAKAMEIDKVDLTIDQVRGFTRDEAKCAMGIVIKVYKNGVMVRKLTYEAKNSDFTVRDRDQLAQTVFDRSLSSILRQAVPEVIAILEQKP